MCGLGGGWLAQHNDMRDQLHKEASIILERPALLEQTPLAELDDNRRPDIASVSPQGVTAHLDIAICRPRYTCIEHVNITPGKLADKIAKQKINKYPELNLIPIIFENRGRPDPHVRKYLQLITQHIHPNRRSPILSKVWQNLSCTLQRGNVRLLKAAGTFIPVAAINIHI